VDEAGNEQQFWTDGFGRTIEVDEPDSSGNLASTTCNAYQPNDYLFQVSHIVGGLNQLRSYSYDQLGRVLVVAGPEGLGTTYGYTNSAGKPCSGNPANVCLRTDGRGVSTTYSYDGLNRLTGKSYSDGSTPAVIYCYDNSNGLCGAGSSTNPQGRLTAMKDGSGVTAWSYDVDGRIVTEQRTIGSITKAISYTYNADGSMSSITYPSGRQVNYVVGNAQRAQSAIDATGTQYAITASYAPAGPLSAVIYGKVASGPGFGGFNASQSFDKRWDLTSILATSSSGTALSITYCYYPLVSGVCPATGSNNNGNVGVMINNKDAGRTETFLYDPLNRIQSASTQATSGADCWGQNFTNDAYGNLYHIGSILTGCATGTLSATVNGSTNQLGFNAPPQPTYDKVGNMTNDGLYGYTFDAEDRITATTASSITYSYDGNGMRVQKSGSTLYWRTVAGDVLAETDAAGNTKNEYVYFAGQRIAWWGGSQLYYLYADSLGSIRTIAEANGAICYDSEYTPYGQEFQHTSNCPSTYNYRFTGYELDPETNLYYAFARYYSSRLGRFMGPDPLGGTANDPQSQNRYAYVGNNPSNFVDPFGMEKCPPGLVWDGDLGACVIIGSGSGTAPPPPAPPPGFGGDDPGTGGNCGGSACPPGTGDGSSGGSGSSHSIANAIKKACGKAPDVLTVSVGGDFGAGVTASGQIGSASNGNSGEFSVYTSVGPSAGLIAYDAYVSGGAVFNAPTNASLNTPPQMSVNNLLNATTASGGLGRVGVSVGTNSIQGTFGPSVLPVTAAVTTAPTRVLLTIPFVGKLLNYPRAICKFLTGH
jgi:RHS repeat-associated protein